MRPRLLVAAVASYVLLSLPAAAQAQCTKDTDCKGDRICRDGMCVDAGAPAPVEPGQPEPMPQPMPAPPVAQPQCTSDAECAPGQLCNNGLCAQPQAVMGTAPPPRRGVSLAITGIVFLGAGLLHLIAGGILMGVGEDGPGSGNLIVGGVCVVVGGIMMPIGLVRMRQSHAPQQTMFAERGIGRAEMRIAAGLDARVGGTNSPFQRGGLSFSLGTSF